MAADYVGLAGPSDKHIFAKSIGGADRPQWPQCTSWGKMFLGSLKLDETGTIRHVEPGSLQVLYDTPGIAPA